MYPNQQPQQNLGFYVPPPMHFDGAQRPQHQAGDHSSLGNMLQNLMSSKPNFDTNLFGGNDKIYQSRYKWSYNSNELSIKKIKYLRFYY